jgi:two-component system phosphate regulon sensor histidine kinase PhoR
MAKPSRIVGKFRISPSLCVLAALLPTVMLALLSRGALSTPAVLFCGAVTFFCSWALIVKPTERYVAKLQASSRKVDAEHAEANANLKRERDVLNAILETMQEGVLLLDASGRIALVNQSLRATFLLPASVIGAIPLEVLRYAELQALLDKARSTQSAVAGELEVSGLKPRRVDVRANMMHSLPGWMLVVFFDVTDIRRLEKLRQEFVANVSHELRTPVASICSATETLLAGAIHDENAATSFVEIIDRNSRRMRRLVEDLLDLSRIESREYRVDTQPVELATAIQRNMTLLAPKARSARIRVDVEIAPDLPRVLADDRALDQVLCNLIENSIKYCPAGSRIAIKGAAIDGMVRVGVEDTGPGIDQRYLPRVFERFYRIDTGRSRDMGGTGLGLSIVKHLVEAMGGSVGVKSRVGFGTTFWFTLPSADAPLSEHLN